MTTDFAWSQPYLRRQSYRPTQRTIIYTIQVVNKRSKRNGSREYYIILLQRTNTDLLSGMMIENALWYLSTYVYSRISQENANASIKLLSRTWVRDKRTYILIDTALFTNLPTILNAYSHIWLLCLFTSAYPKKSIISFILRPLYYYCYYSSDYYLQQQAYSYSDTSTYVAYVTSILPFATYYL